jgi:hypothetical protein
MRTMRDARRMVEASLNSTMERAYAIVDGRAKDFIFSD